jgi:hypothetical protein
MIVTLRRRNNPPPPNHLDLRNRFVVHNPWPCPTPSIPKADNTSEIESVSILRWRDGNDLTWISWEMPDPLL